MKKKLIIYISIISFLIISLIISLIIILPSKTGSLLVCGYPSRYTNNEVIKLDLGKYKMDRYEKIEDGYEIESIKFTLKYDEDLYKKIKKHNAYNSELDFKKDGFYAYGYIVIKDNIFHYELKNKKSGVLSACYGIFDIFENDLDREGKTSMYIPGAYPAYVTEGRFLSDDLSNKYVKRARIFNEESTTFEDALKIYSYLDNNICKIEDNIIYLKGLYTIIKEKRQIVTENYMVKLTDYNGRPLLTRI
jgi:hypothetical protein